MQNLLQHYRTLMRLAIKEAEICLENNEIPVGALLESPQGELLTFRNSTRETPLMHAEFLAISYGLKLEATRWLKGWTLVTTLEPCIMCMGAILIARISTLVFGAYDARWGGVTRILQSSSKVRIPEWPVVIPGILEDECLDLIQQFFTRKRNSQSK